MSSPKAPNSSPASSVPPTGKDSTKPARHDENYFPEDERSSMDWEDDHSTADFDLEEELTAKLGTDGKQPFPANTALAKSISSTSSGNAPEKLSVFEPAAADTATAPPQAILTSRPLISEDVSSIMEDDSTAEDDHHHTSHGEDDHSMTDFDLDAEINAKLGKDKAFPDAASVTEGNAEPKATSASSASEQEQDYIHPGLAASLQTSLAYAAKGATQSDEVDPEPEDSGEDNDTPCPVDPDDAGEASCPADAETAVTGLYADSGKDVNPETPSDPQDEEEDDEEEDDDDDDDEEEEEEEEEEDPADRPMTLRDHLNDLRKRLLRAFLAMLLGFCVCYPFAEEIFNALLIPLIAVLPSSSNLIYTALPEAFFTYMKVAFVAGMFVSSPLVFYQVWAFIAPGLYKEEKIYILPIAFFSAFFFICGGAFCFFVAFPFAFEFFMSYNVGRIQAMPSLSEYLSFVLQLLLAFGFIFELPLFVFFLARLGIVTATWMRKMRRYAVLANVIVSAILTPPDVMSQMLMAFPLLLLYEFSILVAAIFGKKKPEPDNEDEDSEEDKKPALPVQGA